MSKPPKKFGIFLLLPVVCFLSNVLWYCFFPDIQELKTHNPDTTSFMKYRERQWRDEGRQVAIRRQWVSYGYISPFIVRAVVIGEDAKFWRHDGFDVSAIKYALEKDITTRTFELGGSTITQQLAKNLYLSPSKNPIRKIKEAILTWRIERTLRKRRILELYLNVVEWGDGIFGIEAASQCYFGHSAAQLSVHEAAQLAAALPNPIKFKPTSPARYVTRRSRLIYAIMVRQGVIVSETDSTVARAPREVAPSIDSPVVAKETEPKAPESTDIDAMLDSLAK
jgi:monofunctional biosynthetic peptidoglycan transglycosylase